MPSKRVKNAIRLEFASEALVHTNLSGAAFSGECLWVAGDEACGIDRLRRLDPSGTELLRFGDVLSLPPEFASHTPSWLVLYDAPGLDRKDGEYTVFGDVLHQ